MFLLIMLTISGCAQNHWEGRFGLRSKRWGQPSSGHALQRRLRPALSVLLAALCLFTAQTSSQARESQLISDIDALNAAVERYLKAGGSVTSRDNAHLVLTKMRLAKVDLFPAEGLGPDAARITPVFAQEVPAGERWAFWDTKKRKFTMWRGPAHGHVQIIKRFARTRPGQPLTALDGATGTGESARDRSPAATPPVIQRTASRSELISHAWSKGSVDRGEIAELKAPLFDPPSGRYDINDFFLRVHLRNPNGEGVGQIRYTFDGSDWKVYQGEALMVRPGSEIIAFCSTSDSMRWTESQPSMADYSIEPIPLDVSLRVKSKEISAAELSSGSKVKDVFPTLELTTPASVPRAYRSGEYFEFFWTIDGSDPLNSSTAFQLAVDSTGRAMEALPLNGLVDERDDTVVIRAAARSQDRTVLRDSPPVQLEMKIVR